jgi:DNA-directed RNA polymerases I, II, and III subunit RPABC1
MENKVFKAHRTLMQMLADRNYSVAEDHQYTTPENFKNKLVSISAEGGQSGVVKFQNLNNVFTKSNAPDAAFEDPEAVELFDTNKVYVCWQVEEEKVNAELVKRLGIFCTSRLKVGRAIMIV